LSSWEKAVPPSRPSEDRGVAYGCRWIEIVPRGAHRARRDLTILLSTSAIPETPTCCAQPVVRVGYERTIRRDLHASGYRTGAARHANFPLTSKLGGVMSARGQLETSVGPWATTGPLPRAVERRAHVPSPSVSHSSAAKSKVCDGPAAAEVSRGRSEVMCCGRHVGSATRA
jgi:hypothetical protein